MAHFDHHGLEITTASQVAAKEYRAGIALLLTSWPGAAEHFDAAIEADPDFALAYAARARVSALSAQPADARVQVAKAAELAADSTERENRHIAVLSLALNGKPQQALDLALAHLDRWPRDTVIMSLPLGAFGLFAFSGMANHDQARVDLCERHAHHFADDDWWFLANRGWSLVENGEVGRGRKMLERSFQLRSNNAHCVHALSHALYEQGVGEEAAVFINRWLPSYDNRGLLHGHIAWHGALVALERGDVEAALTTYVKHIQPSATKGMPINVVSDCASLLWRIEAYGHKVPHGLWDQVSSYSDRAFPKAGHAFVDAHMLMIAAAMRNRSELGDRIQRLDELVHAGSLGAGAVVPAIGHGLLAFADGDYPECVAILEPFVGDFVRIGGSGAQRDVIEDTLLLALMHAGEARKARALLDRRLHRRPSPRDTLWLTQIPA